MSRDPGGDFVVVVVTLVVCTLFALAWAELAWDDWHCAFKRCVEVKGVGQ